MPLCPTGQKTTIEWQYTGESKQRIEGADNYRLTPLYPARTRYRWEYEISRTNSAYSGINITDPKDACGGVVGLHRKCSGEARKAWDTGADATRKFAVVYAPIYQYEVTDFAISGYPCLRTGLFPCAKIQGHRVINLLCHGGTTPSNTPVWITIFDGKAFTSGDGSMLENTNGGTFNITYNSALDRYEFSPSQQPDWNYFRFTNFDNRPPNQCKLEILKNNVVVYQRTATTCPTVTYFCGDKCPEGTCQCDCGTEVCCYDTTTGRAVKSFQK